MQSSITWGTYGKRIGAGVMALGLLAPFGASALTLRAVESLNLSPEDAIDGNAYIASHDAAVLANMPADLMLATGEAVVGGDIGGDAMIASGNIEMRGDIGGDLRIVSGTAAIGGVVNGDTFVASGEVHILPDSVLRGPAFIVANRVVIEGEVRGPLTIHAANVEISGLIGEGGAISVEHSLSITDGARVLGQLTYRSDSAAMVSQEAEIQGELVHEKTQSADTGASLSAVMGLFSFAWLFAYIASSALLAWLFPVFISRITQHALSHSGRSLLLGLGTVFVTPMIAFVLLLSLVGMVLGILLFAGGIVYLILAKLLAASIAGALLAQWFVKTPTAGAMWAALGAFSLWIIGFVPLLGLLANALLFLAAAGSLTMLVHTSWFAKEKEAILPASNE